MHDDTKMISEKNTTIKMANDTKISFWRNNLDTSSTSSMLHKSLPSVNPYIKPLYPRISPYIPLYQTRISNPYIKPLLYDQIKPVSIYYNSESLPGISFWRASVLDFMALCILNLITNCFLHLVPSPRSQQSRKLSK